MNYNFRLSFPDWKHILQVEEVIGWEWWRSPEFSGYPEFSPKWEDVPDDPDDHLGEWRKHERIPVFFLVQTVRLTLGFRYVEGPRRIQLIRRMSRLPGVELSWGRFTQHRRCDAAPVGARRRRIAAAAPSGASGGP